MPAPVVRGEGQDLLGPNGTHQGPLFYDLLAPTKPQPAGIHYFRALRAVSANAHFWCPLRPPPLIQITKRTHSATASSVAEQITKRTHPSRHPSRHRAFAAPEARHDETNPLLPRASV